MASYSSLTCTSFTKFILSPIGLARDCYSLPSTFQEKSSLFANSVKNSHFYEMNKDINSSLPSKITFFQNRTGCGNAAPVETISDEPVYCECEDIFEALRLLTTVKVHQTQYMK